MYEIQQSTMPVGQCMGREPDLIAAYSKPTWYSVWASQQQPGLSYSSGPTSPIYGGEYAPFVAVPNWMYYRRRVRGFPCYCSGLVITVLFLALILIGGAVVVSLYFGLIDNSIDPAIPEIATTTTTSTTTTTAATTTTTTALTTSATLSTTVPLGPLSPVVVTTGTVTVTLRMDEDFQGSLYFQRSQAFLALQQRICDSWQSAYDELGQTVDTCSLIDVSEGSIRATASLQIRIEVLSGDVIRLGDPCSDIFEYARGVFDSGTECTQSTIVRDEVNTYLTDGNQVMDICRPTADVCPGYDICETQEFEMEGARNFMAVCNCFVGFVWISGTGCIPSCDVSHCLSCFIPDVCLVCESGFPQSSSGACVATCSVEHCTTCLLPDVCHDCDPGYLDQADGGQCQSVCDLDHCISCILPNTCDVCEDRFSLDNGTCVPICGSFCVNCTHPDTCDNCQDGYLLDTGSQCTAECNVHECTNCTLPNLCDLCNAGYFLEGNVCEAECNVADCHNCTLPDICEACDSGYLLHNDSCEELPIPTTCANFTEDEGGAAIDTSWPSSNTVMVTLSLRPFVLIGGREITDFTLDERGTLEADGIIAAFFWEPDLNSTTGYITYRESTLAGDLANAARQVCLYEQAVLSATCSFEPVWVLLWQFTHVLMDGSRGTLTAEMILTTDGASTYLIYMFHRVPQNSAFYLGFEYNFSGAEVEDYTEIDEYMDLLTFSNVNCSGLFVYDWTAF